MNPLSNSPLSTSGFTAGGGFVSLIALVWLTVQGFGFRDD